MKNGLFPFTLHLTVGKKKLTLIIIFIFLLTQVPVSVSYI